MTRPEAHTPKNWLTGLGVGALTIGSSVAALVGMTKVIPGYLSARHWHAIARAAEAKQNWSAATDAFIAETHCYISLIPFEFPLIWGLAGVGYIIWRMSRQGGAT
jgi:hypothetical protein